MLLIRLRKNTPSWQKTVVGIVVARYIIVVVALATAISLLTQQISSIRL